MKAMQYNAMWQCKWLPNLEAMQFVSDPSITVQQHLMAEFVTDANGATWWLNL